MSKITETSFYRTIYVDIFTYFKTFTPSSVVGNTKHSEIVSIDLLYLKFVVLSDHFQVERHFAPEWNAMLAV